MLLDFLASPMASSIFLLKSVAKAALIMTLARTSKKDIFLRSNLSFKEVAA